MSQSDIAEILLVNSMKNTSPKSSIATLPSHFLPLNNYFQRASNLPTSYWNSLWQIFGCFTFQRLQYTSNDRCNKILSSITWINEHFALSNTVLQPDANLFAFIFHPEFYYAKEVRLYCLASYLVLTICTCTGKEWSFRGNKKISAKRWHRADIKF